MASKTYQSTLFPTIYMYLSRTLILPEDLCILDQNTQVYSYSQTEQNLVFVNTPSEHCLSDHKSVPKVGTLSVHFHIHFQNTKN